MTRTWIELALGSLGGEVDAVLVQCRLSCFGYILHIFRWIVTGRPSCRVGVQRCWDVLQTVDRCDGRWCGHSSCGCFQDVTIDNGR